MYDEAKTQDVRPPLGDDPNGQSHHGMVCFGCYVDDDEDDDDEDDDTSSRVEKREEVAKRQVEQDDDDDDDRNNQGVLSSALADGNTTV